MRLLGKALTFDDVLLVPAFSHVLPRDTSLATRFTRRISLNLPLVSAAMDTVTEARLAIAIAQEGGIGIVHKNLTAKQQAAEVARVKRYESGVLRDPITISPGVPVRDVITLSRQHGISGFSGGRGRPRRRHRHRPRSAFRDPAGRAGARDHDPAREAHRRQ
jgi:IMP dehydrogenase